MISYSDTALTISETLQTNAIVWIHSLPEREMGPSRRILEDLEGLTSAGGPRPRIWGSRSCRTERALQAVDDGGRAGTEATAPCRCSRNGCRRTPACAERRTCRLGRGHRRSPGTQCCD